MGMCEKLLAPASHSLGYVPGPECGLPKIACSPHLWIADGNHGYFLCFLLFAFAFLLFLLAELKQGIDCEQLRQGTPNRLDRNNFV